MKINLRKSIAYFFAIILFIILLYHLISQIFLQNGLGLSALPFLIIMLAIIVIILSDFKVLRFGITKAIYFWIEYPDKTTTKIETITEISNFINYNLNAKKYMEDTSNYEIKVISVKEKLLILDTRNIFMDIKEGLKFTLFFNDEIEYSGEKLFVPSQDVALVEMTYVGKLSKGKIIEKYDTFNDRKRVENLEEGQLEGVKAFLKINLDDGFQNTSSEELNSLREIINDIRIGAAK